jgi:hypothetical protein
MATTRQSTERGAADADAAQHYVDRQRAAAAAAS